ncbi:MAG: hypothetical protein WDZ48_00710, partial [Pirellulales bacterium]
DIGQLKVGMPVHFKVDAFPDEEFHGEVRQIRLDAKVTNNVVIYTVAVTTNNDDLKLLPYLSADVKFEVDERRDVLKVPNGAMRYRPRPELIIPAPQAAATQSPQGNGDEEDPSNRRTVWVKHGTFVYPLEVQLGLTDGTESEIVGGAVSEGMELVEGENLAGAPPAEANNPFAPMRFRGTKKNTKKAE